MTSARWRTAWSGGAPSLLLLLLPLVWTGCDDGGRPTAAGEGEGEGEGTGEGEGEGAGEGEGEADGEGEGEGTQPDGGLTDGGVPDGGDPPTDGGTIPTDGGAALDGGGPLDHWPSPRCAAADRPPAWVEPLAGQEGPAVRLRCPGGGVLEVTAREEGVLRLHHRPTDGWARARSFAVRPVDPAAPPPFATVGLADGGVLLCTPRLQLELAPTGCRLRVVDADGTVLLEDGPDGGYHEGQPAEPGGPAPRSLSRRLAPDEAILGLGEKTGPLDRRGRRYVLRNTDAFADAWGGFAPDADPLYQSIPFFVGLRGATAYGLLTDDPFTMRFDFGLDDPERYTIAAAGGALDQWLLAGPSLAEVLRRYTGLTGRMPLPPRWALGYHQSRWGYSPASRVLEIAGELRRRKLPADGVFLDIQHMDGFRCFTWNPETFADPAGLTATLAGQGFHTTVIVDPAIKQDEGWSLYRDGLAGEHYLAGDDGAPYVGEVWPGAAVFPDFSRPATRTWWSDLVAGHGRLGIDGIWIDMNEPASFLREEGGTVPDRVLAAGDGQATTMAEIHNVYALLEAEATAQGLRQAHPDQRPFLLTRAGYAGIQRYAAVWTGDAPSDWNILAGTLPMLLGLGVSGVPWVGSDIGGYSGRADEELYARWMQLGSLSPFSRGHTEQNGQNQEPWAFGPEVEDISRTALGQRYRLLPYLYSLFWEASRSGAPVLRPLAWEFPGDPLARRRGDLALLGPHLLLAPVLQRGVRALGEGEPNFTVALPAGVWYELQSGARWVGPVEVALRLPLGALPLFVREGAILPRGEVVQYTDERPLDPLTLDLWPAPQPTSTVLYEDDGRSLAYQQGQSSAVTYALQRTAGGARLQALGRQGSYVPPARRLIVRLQRVDSGEDLAVRLDGTALPGAASTEALQSGDPAWYWDAADLTLLVGLADRPEFTLEFDHSPQSLGDRPPVPVRFVVTVPAGTSHDSPVHVVTSLDWNRQIPLAWQGEQAVGTVEVPRGEWFFYKFTRGSWETVEKWPGCAEALNRYALGAAHPLRQEQVWEWRDRCP